MSGVGGLGLGGKGLEFGVKVGDVVSRLLLKIFLGFG